MTDQTAPLDLSSSPSANPAPAPRAVADLTLVPPAPVPVIPAHQASTMMAIDDAASTALAQRARDFVAGIVELDPRAPEFTAKVRDVSAMGDADIRKASNVANRMLRRPAAALAAAKGSGSDADPQRKVANTLVELRRTIEDLDPAQVNATGPRKLLGLIPFGDAIRDYFAKYSSAQTHLDRIIQALQSGQDELRKDNAAIEGEKVNLWESMQRLQEYAVLAGALDGAIEQHVDTVEGADPAKATQLRSDLLFAVRQKHQDLLTQLAVSAQGYLALDMVRKNNSELIKGVDRATTTTVSALRTAVIVAQALANQKLVLDQITALNSTTSSLILATSELLEQQTGQIHDQAASATVSLDALKAAFANVYATMDAIDTFKAQAVTSMGQTVQTLETELGKATTYLERARSGEEQR